jgi:UPF0716 protein FxsA
MRRRRLGLAGLALLIIGAVEIALFILVAHWIGIGATILLAVATSLVGGMLLRREGIKAWRSLRAAELAGQPPGPQVSRGLLGLFGGLLLVIPGFLTDAIGLILLVPPLRAAAASGVQWAAERRLSSAAVGDLYGPRRVKVHPGQPTQADARAAADTGEPIEGEVIDPR